MSYMSHDAFRLEQREKMHDALVTRGAAARPVWTQLKAARNAYAENAISCQRTKIDRLARLTLVDNKNRCGLPAGFGDGNDRSVDLARHPHNPVF